MGQKVNPKSFRLSVNKNWDSKWISGNLFAYTLAADNVIRESVNEMLATAGVEKTQIERTSQETKITIFTSRPGIVIGRSGKGILDLKKYILKKFDRADHFKLINSKVDQKTIDDIKKKLIQNIKINISEIRMPQTSAKLMADDIVAQLEKRMPYRKVIKKTLSKITGHKDVKGVKVAVAGRLNGADIARGEFFSSGSIPLSTLKTNVDYAYSPANTSHGMIGVKVWIYKEERK